MLKELNKIKGNFTYEAVGLLEWLEDNTNSETYKDFETWYNHNTTECIMTNNFFTGGEYELQEFVETFFDNEEEAQNFIETL